MAPPMRSQLIGPTLARVRAAGGDVGAVLASAGLDASAATAAEVVLPLPALYAFFDAAERESKDRFLGLHMAVEHPRGVYGILEFTCRSAPTVREAVVRIVRYVGLLNELVSVGFEEQDGLGIIEHRIAGAPLCVGRHVNEFVVATLLVQARALSGATCVPERVWLAHPQPDDVSELLQLLCTTRVRFDAGRNGLALPRAVLDLPLLSSDPPLLDVLDRAAAGALAGRPEGSPLLALLRRRVRETLAEGPPTLASLARALRLSPRTLQRRLSEEGTALKDVVDEVRQDLALEYVRDARRPLGEVAYLLGYAELTSFLRAFKRWTGKTPGEVRTG
jgi:AraC-like DNA-binding protein